jgi:hypothetical protein
MDDGSQNQRHSIKIVVGKGIGLLIVAKVERFSFPHEVHGVGGQADKDYFHDEEVETSPDEDQVEVAG